MPSQQKSSSKSILHPRNKNRDLYDLDALIIATPELKKYIISKSKSKSGVKSIDFSNPKAVKLLNKAILNHYYGVKYWEFPDENLCPPIPGRADYIHYVADLLAESNMSNITCLDIGTGASCIYPIIGAIEYDWDFIASDIDPKSIESAKKIINANSFLLDKIECKLQPNSKNIYKGIIKNNENIDVTISNPPFHANANEASAGARRKVKNLSRKKLSTLALNFSGSTRELIYDGGEYQFIQNMITESKTFAKNCFWFTTLVSKESNLKGIYMLLEGVKAKEIKTIPMAAGNKKTRIVAWTFLKDEERNSWKK